MAASRFAAALTALAGTMPLSSAAMRAPVESERAGRPAMIFAPCPADELSCGRQRPVLSNGRRAFENENFALTVVFPRGSAVCLTRSGDEPHGFFAVYEGPRGCPERPERPARYVVIHADFNAVFRTSLAQAVPADCTPLHADAALLRGRLLSFPGLASIACRAPAAAGRIELFVYALGGPWQAADEENGGRSRAAVYFAVLGSTPARWNEDLARFRRVLATVRIRRR